MSEDTSNEGWSSEHYGFETEPVVQPSTEARVTRSPGRATKRRLMVGSMLAVALVAGSGSFAASYAVTHDGHHRAAQMTHPADLQRPSRGR